MAGANAPSPADNPPEPDMPSPAGSVPGVDGGAAGDPAADDLWSDDDIVGTTAAAQPISPTLGADDAADWNLEDVNWGAPPPSPPAP
ncbi:MAG: hypothetical protein O3C67_08690, partial [Cyanobacteria bacterium]|nr:hypothetical protein [Cyanobacteriota bacterium]